MDASKLQTLKGFRDFLPNDAGKRQHVINIIRNTFEIFGFEPLETPALEYQEVLLGKYGAEADQLIYTFQDKGGRNVALRYDQTVPTARVIAQYKDKLTPPWKRYQIQPVWRAEKPQKGRFREFLQCDADIYGSISPIADAEIIAASYKVLENLGFENFKILINDRLNLFNLMRAAQIPDNLHFTIIQSIDKLDKKPQQEVIDELSQKGLKDEQVNKLFDELNQEIPSPNLESIMKILGTLGVIKGNILFKPYLARGLDYYTGTIFEIVVDGYSGGSIAGGGRYDGLIEKLSGVSVPAVGIAFGFDRTVEAMEQFELFQKNAKQPKILVTIFNPGFTPMSCLVATNLRDKNIKTDIFPDENTKMEKQLKYANKKEFDFVIIIGPDEVRNDLVVLKNLKTSEQEKIKLKDLVSKIMSYPLNA